MGKLKVYKTEKDDYNIPCKMNRDLNYYLQKNEESDHYHKVLEEIEGVLREDHSGDYDYMKWRIDNIINKAKGEVDESIDSL